MSRIVVIEDVADIAMVYAEVLTQDGHRVQVVENNYEQWLYPGQWVEAAADVAIIDIGLPGPNVTGLAIARVAAMQDPRPWIVIATAMSDLMSDEDKAVADVCLGKPFRIAELRAAVGGGSQ